MIPETAFKGLLLQHEVILGLLFYFLNEWSMEDLNASWKISSLAVRILTCNGELMVWK